MRQQVLMVANPRPCCRPAGITSHPDLPPCAGCGRCCHLVVELRPEDLVPEEFAIVRGGTRCMDQRGDGACVALDPLTMLCTIYSTRPQTCRDFNRGEALCRRVLAAGRNLSTMEWSQPDSPTVIAP